MPSNACGSGRAGSRYISRCAAPAGSRARSTRPLTDNWLGRASGRRLRGAGPLGQQGIDVGGPAVDVGGGSRRSLAGRHRLRHQRRTAFDVAAAHRQRIGGPDRFDNVVAQRVSFTIGGRGGPMFHHPAGIAGRGRTVDDVFEFAKEVRRAPRLDSGRTPVMAGHQQGVLGPGDRYVQQPALLVDTTLIELAAVLGDLVRQLLSVGDIARCPVPGRRASPSRNDRRAAAAAAQRRR